MLPTNNKVTITNIIKNLKKNGLKSISSKDKKIEKRLEKLFKK